jgi:LmeA-like phospholipid-binding
MELLTILLSGLLGIITPAGFIIDRTAENTLRSQFTKAEQLQVRVDNAPTYQLLQGKIESVRIAGRSLQLKKQDIRIALLELETDVIELEPRSLRGGKPKLKRPFQSGMRLVLNQEDVNKILQSPRIIEKLQQIQIGDLDSSNIKTDKIYKFINPKVEFLTNNRIKIQVELQEKGKKKSLLIVAESGLSIVRGRQIQLVDPLVVVDKEVVPPQFLNVILNNINKRLDLGRFEDDGLQMRILKLNVRQAELEIAAFFRIQPSSRFLETPRS